MAHGRSFQITILMHLLLSPSMCPCTQVTMCYMLPGKLIFGMHFSIRCEIKTMTKNWPVKKCVSWPSSQKHGIFRVDDFTKLIWFSLKRVKQAVLEQILYIAYSNLSRIHGIFVMNIKLFLSIQTFKCIYYLCCFCGINNKRLIQNHGYRKSSYFVRSKSVS